MKANGSLGSKDWDSITPSPPSFNGRNGIRDLEEGKGYALRVPRGQGAGDFRRRGYSEGPMSRVYSLATPLVAMPPPRPKMDRNLVSDKCVAMAKRTQEAMFDAYELDDEMKDMTLWVHARVVPLKWRRQVLTHLEPIYCQMRFCREELVRGWKLLHPPFYQPNLDSFDRRLGFFVRSVQLLTSAIEECKTKLLRAEALAACRYIQLWTRRLLAKRGFYTKVIKLSYHHRGIVSGMFDSITGTSKLTARRPDQTITLEYPRSDKNWDSFSS
ncbi:hypothetical protein F441_18896 [Phytophthora nicotianae CJ01A1]|uniref:Uncharacterized protein n=6 Tax=Phytophthora nicotianae TaxID=4792 RepID=V9E7B4_PHYNI|nr:hypothetical protein F443_19087 [Phytophthora nicotianae P1569]ETK74782.1 hypothetical protein L915_18512 [Phytophthora nicotianae]ETO63224.1 hypothetical protein F444_19040 [Phytophthora nicotianae P1976]ETP04332.1 hypothetical protein F441_18896 [Phytophthora nicotianae CJ01A1]ETP32468.1 hypothetical protein F442_18868 [Phytophthora nicotianae P10297]